MSQKEINLYSPDLYFNRELSLLEFNSRVLKEAEEPENPLLERLKFTSILSSNLDEFFMIRVAGLKSQIAAGVEDLSYDGKTPREQLFEIRRRLLPLYKRQENVLNEEILPGLEEHGIKLHRFENLSDDDKKILESHFIENVLPVLTPLSLGPANPFPRLINRSLNVAFLLKDNKKEVNEEHVAFLQIPPFIDRFVKLDWHENEYSFVLIEHIIKAFAHILFPGLEIIASNTFRVVRDADIEIAEDEAEDLLSEIEEQVKQRRWGRAAVRLEISSKMPDHLGNLLMNMLDLEPQDVYVLERPLNLPDFMEFLKIEKRDLKDKPFSTRNIPEFTYDNVSIWDAMKHGEYMVHHPFDSFTNSTLKLINSAATDKNVLSIKITLYRTGMNSDIVTALKKAAENGKSVTAFVELKARFDEEKNIIWAKELERKGVHVVYGVPGLKTHCKIAYIVRREHNKLKSYIHMSTGNYNQITARLYTDIGFFTADDDFAHDANHLFNLLTGYSYYDKWKRFIVAPVNLYNTLIEYIQREIDLHTPENPGMIIVKTNSLAHREIIPALYKASQAGVKIKLIVRGICCLKPAIPEVSDNIEVRSIIGRFLEHTRIFYFKNGGSHDVYLSSADWMSRNLHRRVETMFPILNEKIKKELIEMLHVYWKDNTKSWQLLPDGSYKKLKPLENEEPFSAQEYFLKTINS
jgi:polyphosphate kinase